MTDQKTPPRRPERAAAAATMGAALKAARSRTGAPPAPVVDKGAPAKAKSEAKPATKSLAKSPVKPAAKSAPKASIGKVVATPAKPVTKAAPPKTAPPKIEKPALPATSAPKSVAATVPKPAASPRVPLPKGDSFKLRMLVDEVIKATGGKKKGVKELVEATLSRIGEALARGDELNLPGFGKVRVVKSDAKDGTAIMTLKLRQGGGKGSAKPGQKALADSGDDD